MKPSDLEYSINVFLDNTIRFRWWAFCARFDRKLWRPRFNASDVWLMRLLVYEELEARVLGITREHESGHNYEWDRLADVLERLEVMSDDRLYQSEFDNVIAPGGCTLLTHVNLSDLWGIVYDELRRVVESDTPRFDIDRIADTHEKIDALLTGKAYTAVFNW